MDAIYIFDSSGQLVTSRRYSVMSDGYGQGPTGRFPSDFLKLMASRSRYQVLSPIFVDKDSCKTYLAVEVDGVCLVGEASSNNVAERHVLLEVLCSIGNTLRKYYGKPLTDDVIKGNFKTIYPIFDEVIETGLPFALELNSLESTVVPPASLGIVDKLATVMSPMSTPSISNSLTSVSPDIWWRRAGVLHSSNEFYIEVVERVNCCVSPDGKLVAGSLSGSLNANCKLSGLPELLLSFKDPTFFDQKASIAFHPCIRVPRWQRDKKLSFTPPDGDFTVADYIVVDKKRVTLPFSLTCSIAFEADKGSISVLMSPKLSVLDPSLVPTNPNRRPLGLPQTQQKPQNRLLEDVVVKIKAPRSIGSATLVTHSGSALFDATTRLIVWSPGTVKPDSATACKVEGTLLYNGTSNAAAVAKEFRCSATVEFTVRGWNPSGVRVESVDVSGVDYTPFKGCRYTTCGGSIDIRL